MWGILPIDIATKYIKELLPFFQTTRILGFGTSFQTDKESWKDLEAEIKFKNIVALADFHAIRDIWIC